VGLELRLIESTESPGSKIRYFLTEGGKAGGIEGWGVDGIQRPANILGKSSDGKATQHNTKKLIKLGARS